MKELVFALMTVCVGLPDCSTHKEQHQLKIERKDCGTHRALMPANGEWVDSEIRFKC